MKKVITAALAVSVISSSCYAAVTETGNMKVNIQQETGKASVYMNVEIWAPDKSIEDLVNNASAENILVFKKDLKTADDGSLTLDAELGGSTRKSGIYTLEISGDGFHKEETFFMVNEDFRKGKIDEVNVIINDSDKSDDEKKAEIAKIVKTDTYDLGIVSKSYVNDNTAGRIAEVLMNSLKEKNTALTYENASEYFNKATAVTAVEKSLIESVTEDENLFVLKNSEIADYYTKSYATAETGKRMAKRLNGKSFSTIKAFDDAVTEAFVLSVIEDPDGVDNTKSIMQAFSDKIGTGASGSEARYLSVTKKSYSSYTELKNAFDGYKESGNTGSSGSGSGSSGGNKTGGSSIVVGSDYITDEPKNTYPMTIFDDIDSVPWAEDAIVTLAEKGIINGKGDNKFCPNDYITREEFVTLVAKAFLSDYSVSEISFADVNDNEWYTENIKKVCAAGVVKGVSDNVFGLGENILRQDICTMLYRTAEVIGSDLETESDVTAFADDALISDYAKAAVYALKNKNVVNGVDETNFAPLDLATRAEAAKMLYKMLDLRGGI